MEKKIRGLFQEPYHPTNYSRFRKGKEKKGMHPRENSGASPQLQGLSCHTDRVAGRPAAEKKGPPLALCL